jgi:hypothetical protein
MNGHEQVLPISGIGGLVASERRWRPWEGTMVGAGLGAIGAIGASSPGRPGDPAGTDVTSLSTGRGPNRGR